MTREEFLTECKRLARYIERSMHDIAPDEFRAAWDARNSALCADQVAFEQSEFFRGITLADVAKFTFGRVSRRQGSWD